jgi:hypothetical protein
MNEIEGENGDEMEVDSQIEEKKLQKAPQKSNET